MTAKVVRSRQVKTHVQKSHVNIKVSREEQKYVDGKSRLKFEKYTQVIQKSSVKSRESCSVRRILSTSEFWTEL